MAVYNKQSIIITGLRNRLQRVFEKHMGNNWPEALNKIDQLMIWIKEAEAK